MPSNSFGNLFRITTWGESHGKAIGVVIDGCPAGLALSESDIQKDLDRRRPGQSKLTTERQEGDRCEIYSGVFEGFTTGAPLSIIIHNQDARSQSYLANRDKLRPGHANFTYLEKYGRFDYRGGGRASARETAMRVGAGAVAKKLLKHYEISLSAHLHSLGDHYIESFDPSILQKSPLFCPCPKGEASMLKALERAKEEGDSLGGVIELVAQNLPVGLGDPVYEKLEANLAKAMLSIPASKGIEFGAGFNATRMRGSEHNDPFTSVDGQIKTESNHAGGLLGGISTGMPLNLRVAFKPTSSIKRGQKTVDNQGNAAIYETLSPGRHDPAVVIRAVPVVEAMGALTLADALLMNRLSKI